MRSHSTQKLVLTAVFTALVFIATFSIRIPVGTGYINPGDGVIYAAAIFLGGPLAAIAAGLGSALADLFAGYAVYAPATLIIKAAMALVVGLAFGRTRSWPLRLGLMAVASLIMAGGYFLYEFMFYKLLDSAPEAAVGNVLANLTQAVGGVVIGMVLVAVLDKVIPAHWKEILK